MAATDGTTAHADPLIDSVTARSGRSLPADRDLWVFVLGDFVIFSSYFLIFMVYRNQQHALFLESQRHLNVGIGMANTLVLLTSSLFIATAVRAARAGKYVKAGRLTVLSALCGVVFTAIKAYEWWAKISIGMTFTKNDFFMFYYLLTGVHLFHVVLGLIFLGVVFFELRSPQHRRPSVVESGAVYWHMVDLLWIVIFALIYLMR